MTIALIQTLSICLPTLTSPVVTRADTDFKGLDEICSHMKIYETKPRGYWSYEKCLEAALLCKTKKEFKDKYSSAIYPARKNGWVDG